VHLSERLFRHECEARARRDDASLSAILAEDVLGTAFRYLGVEVEDGQDVGSRTMTRRCRSGSC
jgi:hypothetical protein